MTAEDDRGVSVGRVFSRTFGVMRSNPLVVFGTALIFSAIPQFFFNAFLRRDQTGVALVSATSTAQVVGTAVLAFLVALVLQSIVSGCITRATIAYSNGQRTNLGDCLSVALRRALPVIAVSVLSAIAIMLGFVLLLVPGLILTVMWAVAVPVVVTEDVGVFGAFGRSVALTAGARWTIVGIYLLVVLIMIGVGIALGILSGLALGASFQNPTIMWEPLAIAFALISYLLSATLIGCSQTALFVELREWKDGPEDSKLGDIFA